MLTSSLFLRSLLIFFYIFFARGHACEAAVFAQVLDKNGHEEVVQHHVQQQNAPADAHDLSRDRKKSAP